VLVTTTDMLADDATTASAFLIAYLQGLADLADSANATGFAPHDGGFGARDEGGGTAELSAYLAGILDGEPVLDALIDDEVLRFAQSWWGLPANPTDSAATADPADPVEEAA
jgi:hypothetical protein